MFRMHSLSSSLLHHDDRDNDGTIKAVFDHSTAQRVNTLSIVATALKQQYPKLDPVIVSTGNCDLFGYASSTSKAAYTIVDDVSQEKHADTGPQSLRVTAYIPASRRTDEGGLKENLLLGKFTYKWASEEFLVYIVDGRDGSQFYPQEKYFYILHSDKSKASALAEVAGKWTSDLHDEVWVFEGGYWSKSKELYDSIKNASWDSVILDPAMKKALINDHLTFFNSRDRYAKLKVPWKRGIIYHGPPGNGKTISIKATMNMLYSLDDPIPTLYVRSLSAFGGPEVAVKSIFSLARRTAPCYLVFEDLDSIISDEVRSYFLNEVDGLKANDGVFMLGSTNHLDRLDPGIAKRPSRFDRKYLFADPNKQERIAYCHFWQTKLHDNKDVDFPDILCEAIANITDKFSFAYMQEAFVASLLAIARDAGDDDFYSNADDGQVEGDWVGVKKAASETDEGDDLEKYILWTEMKKQVANLRESMGGEE